MREPTLSVKTVFKKELKIVNKVPWKSPILVAGDMEFGCN